MENEKTKQLAMLVMCHDASGAYWRTARLRLCFFLPQMVFGVGPAAIYLTNPLEGVAESVLADQLCSPSVLLVRALDVIRKFLDSECDLGELTEFEDPRWQNMNVLGQVVGVLREYAAAAAAGSATASDDGTPMRPVPTAPTHVRIPADYFSGVTLALKADNAYCQELMECPELPLEKILTGQR